ncbi:hypothetical protein GMRT_11962 [Giardia muris]|uniref:Uncharacterized protein n=1 Tax=Giardia muris TaxID=5742 RepID=A0A4Z1T9M2_GIAMU|nr:hypothetical protein GMRT_11962 [Giardia muris]|eukprot:TNJ29219.1 hypothetical protein GMRT_11962 [Giardia muris]
MLKRQWKPIFEQPSQDSIVLDGPSSLSLMSTEPAVGGGPTHTVGYRPTIFSTVDSLSEHPRTTRTSESITTHDRDLPPRGSLTSEETYKDHSIEYSDLLREPQRSQRVQMTPGVRDEQSRIPEGSRQVSTRMRPLAESTDPCDGSLQIWGDVMNNNGMDLQETALGQCSVSSLPHHDAYESSQQKPRSKPRQSSQTSVSEGSPAVFTDTLQTITESQRLAIQIAQAEYLLCLLRNERVQQLRVFTGLLSALTTEYLAGRSKQLLRFKEMEQVARINVACRDFMHATNGVLEHLTTTLTPLMPMRLKRLNEAVESVQSLKLKGVSMFPIPETILSVQQLTDEVHSLVDRLQPKEIKHLPVARNINTHSDLEILSSIGRLTSRLQGLIYEQAVLNARHGEVTIQ